MLPVVNKQFVLSRHDKRLLNSTHRQKSKIQILAILVTHDQEEISAFQINYAQFKSPVKYYK